MLILGISGGRYLPQEVSYVVPQYQHDAAAVLVEDGAVVAGVEEERLNRIKHTNRAPLYSPRLCLAAHGVTGRDLDHVAFYLGNARLDVMARRAFMSDATLPVFRDARGMLEHWFATQLGIVLPPERFHFVPHHLAHAVSAFALSGYERGLVVTLDAEGDHESGLVAIGARESAIEPITTFTIADSLGYLFQEAIAFLGYKVFDEYKVMGLAPYGDPARYREAFRPLYTLLPDGGWRLHREKIVSLYDVLTPRRKGEEFTQVHKDFAASLQAVLEDVAFHLLTHYRKATGERNLCLAGGVAHNCTLNGKILASGLFDQVFVQPAAHDAGAALGAALQVYLEQRPAAKRGTRAARAIRPMEHLYWGSDIGSDRDIRTALEGWSDLVAFERVDDICGRAAALIADGCVLGWAQGRSEFGPRALGNRSIVADPRPAEQKQRINAMVKKRESYRPFAPSVLAEDAGDYFVLPAGVDELPYMIFVVGVREDKRALLGAITHVDGTARVQTVSRKTNDRYWRLIDAFKALTGVPVLLNTSFNNSVEPIVDSVEDAIVCFLTTGLDYLAVGDWLVWKRQAAAPESARTSTLAYARLAVSVPPHYHLQHTKAVGTDWRERHVYQLTGTWDVKQVVTISRGAYDVLLAADGVKTVGELLGARRGEPQAAQEGQGAQEAHDIVREIVELWSLRAVTLRPVSSAGPTVDRTSQELAMDTCV
jgi:carbamoyltransferase